MPPPIQGSHWEHPTSFCLLLILSQAFLEPPHMQCLSRQVQDGVYSDRYIEGRAGATLADQAGAGETQGEEGLLRSSRLVGTPSGKEGTLAWSLQSPTSLLCVSGQVTHPLRTSGSGIIEQRDWTRSFQGAVSDPLWGNNVNSHLCKIFYLSKHLHINDFLLLEFSCRLLSWIPFPVLHRREI